MNVLTNDELYKIDAYYRASNYIALAQIYLRDNPLLKRPLEFSDVKTRLVGHWGTVPGQTFIYTHLNRIINKYDLNMMYISGPGHGGNAIVAHTYLEGTYSEVYPNITEDEEGLKKLFKQFSFPCGISSHVAPETPGSINEGGELGYSLSHAYGAVLDNPDLIVACVVGDGEAETGPLAGSWILNKIINPKTDGVVLPILHLNGYKIANPTIWARMSDEDLNNYFTGLGYKPYFVNANEVSKAHQDMAYVLDCVVEDIKRIKNGDNIKYPMIVFRSPKGWTGPKEIDGKQIEGSFRAHQVPIEVTKEHPESLKRLEDWLKSYHPEELFTVDGKLKSGLKELAPKGTRRMGMNPHSNGGNLLKELIIPDFRTYAVDVKTHGCIDKQDMRELGVFIKDIVAKNKNNYRIFGPDEALSNRLNHVFEVTNRQWNAEKFENDEFLSSEGRVIDSVLSEHSNEGMLEGYLLTGRHGFIHSYEAFARIIDSMVSQHSKWLKICSELPWRKSISSLNIILASHVWQQDHNGYTHQEPGFLNHLATKKSNIVRAYLPPDANTLICTYDKVAHSKDMINAIVASKHPHPQWLSMEEAEIHCNKGIGVWDWASNDKNGEPDLVIASCGDVPTVEALATTDILRKEFPELKVRFVNVIDLFKLQYVKEHPTGLTDLEYDRLFTKDKPVIFAFHGYPNLIRELTYNRHNKNFHVRGYIEEGSITTPFDMRVQNELDRYHLTILALKQLPFLGEKADKLITECQEKLIYHKNYIKEHGIDIDEVLNWKWEDNKKIQ